MPGDPRNRRSRGAARDHKALNVSIAPDTYDYVTRAAALLHVSKGAFVEEIIRHTMSEATDEGRPAWWPAAPTQELDLTG